MSEVAQLSHAERRVRRYRDATAAEAEAIAAKIAEWRAAHPAEADWLDANATEFWKGTRPMAMRLLTELNALGTINARSLWAIRRHLIPAPLTARRAPTDHRDSAIGNNCTTLHHIASLRRAP